MANADLTQRARDELLQSILDGRLATGERLVVTELAASLDMSRTPVRDALKRLAVARVVNSNGNGYEVAQPTQRDVRDLLDLLLLLEPYAAGDAASADPASRTDHVQRLTAAARESTGHRFHVTLGTLSANRYLGEAVVALNNRLATARANVSGPCQTESHHAAMILAIESGDAEGAQEAAVEHVRAMKDEIYRVRS